MKIQPAYFVRTVRRADGAFFFYTPGPKPRVSNFVYRGRGEGNISVYKYMFKKKKNKEMLWSGGVKHSGRRKQLRAKQVESLKKFSQVDPEMFCVLLGDAGPMRVGREQSLKYFAYL